MCVGGFIDYFQDVRFRLSFKCTLSSASAAPASLSFCSLILTTVKTAVKNLCFLTGLSSSLTSYLKFCSACEIFFSKAVYKHRMPDQSVRALLARLDGQNMLNTASLVFMGWISKSEQGHERHDLTQVNLEFPVTGKL